MRNWTEFRKLSDGGASLLFLRMRIAIRTAPVAAHVSLGQLELLSFVFAKLAAVLFHPDWLDTYFEVVQQHIWRSLLWERHYLCIPHIWCHIRLITCIVDSNSVLFLIFHTYNLQDKKKSSKLSLPTALRLCLFLCDSHYSVMMTCWLILLTFYDAQSLHAYYEDRPKLRGFFFFFFSSLHWIYCIQSLAPSFLFFYFFLKDLHGRQGGEGSRVPLTWLGSPAERSALGLCWCRMCWRIECERFYHCTNS